MYAQLFQYTMTLRWGVQGVLVAMIYQFTACVVIDCIISDAPWDNLKNLKRNKFSTIEVVVSLVSCQIIWSSNPFWAWYFLPDFTPCISLTAVLSVVLSIAVAETIFTSAHVYMHQFKMFGFWVHKFHHCCLSSSISSNYVFNPLDGFLESYGPWLSAWAVYKFVVKDPWGLWLSLYIIQTWYLLDHDENVRTPHWFHHKFIDSEYNAYTAVKMHTVKDQLRTRVKRSDK